MLKIYTKYDRPEKEYELIDDTLVVERAGYVPAKQQIESMMYAGLRLQDFRKEDFDGEDEEEALANYDPTRDPSFDLADVSRLMSDIEARATKGSSGAETRSTSESVPVESKADE